MISSKFSLRTSKAGTCFIVAAAVMGAVLMVHRGSYYADHPAIGGVGLGAAVASFILLAIELGARWRQQRFASPEHWTTRLAVLSYCVLILSGAVFTSYGLSCVCDDPKQAAETQYIR